MSWTSAVLTEMLLFCIKSANLDVYYLSCFALCWYPPLLSVLPGAVRPSALPPPQSPAPSPGRQRSVLPWRSRVCGASVPHLLLAALPPVGRVFDAGPPDAAAHPVRAQQWLPWQQLCSHHAHLQKRQSATGEKHLDGDHVFVIRDQWFGGF